MRGAGGPKKGRLNFLNRGNNRRGFSLTRTQQDRPMSQSSRRTMSTGRQVGRSRSPWGRNRSKSTERQPRARSPWGRKKKEDRRVSISKVVERIDTRPVSRGSGRPMSRGSGRGPLPPAPIMGRGRSAERRTAGMQGRGRSKERKSRSRSWSLGRRKKDKSTNGQERNGFMGRLRSKSQERPYNRAYSFNDEDSYDGGRKQKRGFFRRRSRERRQDHYDDEYESSSSSFSEESDERPGGFFGF